MEERFARNIPALSEAQCALLRGKKAAVIGCGGQGAYDVCSFERHSGLCEIVALVDTDIGAAHTLETLKKHPGVPRFHDFRQMFDRMEDGIDAVLVAIPDHTHYCACIEAMRRGKAVYVEKPLAHSFRECELLMKAERETGVVCQMGNQGHSGDNYFQYRDYVAAGILKDVTRVVAHMNMQRRWHKWGGKVSSYPKAEPLPATLDWDKWVGAAPWHDFSKDLAYGEWRCWYDYGNGCMGDWGAHILDCVHQFTLKGALPGRWSSGTRGSTTSRRCRRDSATPTTRGYFRPRPPTTGLSTRRSSPARRSTSRTAPSGRDSLTPRRW